MFRAILSAVTIAAMLLCPLRCSATEATAPGEAQVGCSCCQSACPVPTEQAPGESSRGEAPAGDDLPDGDCECANCLCHGAVLESAGKQAALTAFDLSVDQQLVDMAPVAVAAPRAALLRNTDDSWCLSGRAVCIIQQSLQI